MGNEKVTFKSDWRTGQCWGAFAAIQGVATIQFADESQRALSICAPPESTLVQLIKVFVTYANQHPERGHEDFWAVAYSALFDVFPCD